MKKSHLILFALGAGLCAQAETVEINQAEYYGPFMITTPMVAGDMSGIDLPDSIDVKVNIKGQPGTQLELGGLAPACADGNALHVVKFNVENRQYGSATLEVTAPAGWKATCDGKDAGRTLKLHPGTHEIMVRYLSNPETEDTLKISLDAPDGLLRQVVDGSRIYTLEDVMVGTRVSGGKLSPSGKYMIASYYTTDAKGDVKWYQVLYDVKTGKPMHRLAENSKWMNASDRYYAVRTDDHNGRHIVATDPATGIEEVIAIDIPKGTFYFGPTDEYLIYSKEREGKKANPKAYQILEPDDRQPRWRDRNYPAIYRYKEPNGALTPLAYGKDNAMLLDISADGKKALVVTSHSRLQHRPTTVASIFNLDLATMEADTLVWEDGFVGSAVYSPNADKVLLMGSPEAFGRIGCTLPDSVTPSMIQQEFFIMDLATKEVTPISKDFDYNPQDMEWSKQDGNIYFTAEKRDLFAIYKYDTKKGVFVELPMPEMYVFNISLADKAPLMAWCGQSDSNPSRLYITDLKSNNTRLIDAPMAERLKDVRLATSHEWNFVNERGDTIYGSYYLPDNFDPEKKYPLIVNYYGGCSPSQRYMESRYPWHVYSQLGYVVYVVQPRGATGFGQEFSACHVNTAGNGPAQDIIEGTKKFVEAHPYVNADKIGCIGASYGGFMTQYLQTVTDIFAAAVSHAGISDHTSYWGEGYWGYSYSEVSMANSYPWSETELYVKQSPLYNADKIHTPILFLHGDADTNVPVGESIQMFTALKLLGRPTALIQFEGEDHFISDFEKRRLWQDAIFAWFAKYLQDDNTWWSESYED